MGTATFGPGSYRYIPAVFQYSGGVAAEPGYRLERVMFKNPVPLKEGFARISEIIRAAGRPLTSFAACELRSPAPFSEEGFRAFNEVYVGTLAEWGIFDPATRTNPVARSNVCPEIEKPAGPSFYAFVFTVPDASAAPSFHVAGSGEAAEGKGNYRDHTVRLGDTSPSAIKEKAQFVLGEMERRMALLGFKWADTTASQLYTVHDPHPFLASEIVRRGAATRGLTWHFARPPVVDLEYEMDCRGIAVERVA
jgi:hypothetical protein